VIIFDRADSLLRLSHIRLDRENIKCIENLDCLGPVTNLYLQWVSTCTYSFILYNIVQGSTYADLRQKSAEASAAMQVKGQGYGGFAIGGLAVGEGHEAMKEVLQNVMPFLQFLAELSFLAIISTCQSQTIQIFTQEYQNEKPN